MVREKIAKQNFEKMTTQRVEFLSRDKDWIKYTSDISALIPQYLIPHFGKHDFTYRGEYLVKCWSFRIKCDYFFLFSANGRGTTLESTTVNIDIITIFLKELFKILYNEWI